MSTTLLNAEIELSKQLSDYWAGTTTSSGSSTTLVDTALMAKENDWITDDAYDMITSGSYNEQERKISSLDNSNGTLTVLAHGGTIASGVSYRVHRLFTASKKREALVWAAQRAFPDIFKPIWDESLVSGNWLKDGSFERWTSSTVLTDWSITTVTATQTTTSPYYKHGATSCKLSTAAGYISQSITNWDDLKYLAGKTVTYTLQGQSDTASCLRIAIYDGTTTTYSDYHDGDSAWTENNEPLEVQATIQDNPTAIEFRVHHDVAAGTSYADDARVIFGDNTRTYIGHLGLAQNQPHQVLVEPSDYSTSKPWILVTGVKFDYKNGYMYLPSTVEADYRLRILGIGYLDFLLSGVASTSWSATIDIDTPQLDILVAKAALYLCDQMIVPNDTSGTSATWTQAKAYWAGELDERIQKFGMETPESTVDTGM